MIDGSFSLLPFYNEKSGGGYLYACCFDGSYNHFFGALGSQRFIFEHMIKREEIDVYIHSIGESILDYIEELPSHPYIFTAWNLQPIASILIQCLLDRGFATSKKWNPEEKQIYYIEGDETLFLAVNFGNKKIVKFYSLRLFVARSDWISLTRQLFPTDRISVLESVPDWREPEESEVQALADEARYVYTLSIDMAKFGAFGSAPQIISASGYSYMSCRALIREQSKDMITLNTVLTPSMLPEDRKKAYQIMHKLFENNKASAISYLKNAGEYSRVSSVDLNSAYGSALCSDRLPYGVILEDKPEGEYLEIVFPEGIYEVREDKIPIMCFGSSFSMQHYHFEDEWNLGENAKNFMLDGTLAFLKKEWKLIRNYYEVVGNEKITRKYVKTASNTYIKNYIQNLYDSALRYPERKKYFKSQIVGFFGKFIQNTELQTQIYYNNEVGIRRRQMMTEEKSPTFYVLGWYVASTTRIKILEKLEKIDLNDIVYIDTDAIYLKNLDKYIQNFKISDKIGDWKIEFKNCSLNIFAKKKYQILYENGKVETKCSGLNKREKEKLEFGDLDYGLSRVVYIFERDKNTYILKPIKKRWVLDDQAITNKRIEGVYYD